MTAPTPAEAGFHMPAEGARHTKTWMAWPSRIDLWNGRHVEAKAAYAAVAQAIARFELHRHFHWHGTASAKFAFICSCTSTFFGRTGRYSRKFPRAFGIWLEMSPWRL